MFISRRVNTALVVTCTQINERITLRFVNGHRIEYELASFEAALDFVKAFDESINRRQYSLEILAVYVYDRGNDTEGVCR